jgi:GNAT superfamily N-acetyltransferase
MAADVGHFRKGIPFMSQPLTDDDRSAVKCFIERHWHDALLCIKGRVYHPHLTEGFLIRQEGDISGLVTYCSDGDDILLLTQNSLERGAGIGTSLVLKVIDVARQRGARRVWLTTSNANLDALGFYQRLGFRIVAVYRDGLDHARRSSKPSIPEFAPNGLPIHDEIELELQLKPYIEATS